MKKILIYIVCLFVSCSDDPISEKNWNINEQIISLNNYISYDVVSNSFWIKYFNLYIKNMYQYAFSPNKSHLIYSTIAFGDEPEIIIMGKGQITNDDEIQMYPSINDNGDYVYCSFGNSTAVSKVILNGKIELSLPDVYGLFKYSTIDSQRILVVYERLYDDRHFLLKYNLFDSMNYELILLPFIPQEILPFSFSEYLIQGYHDGIYDIYMYNAIDNSFVNLTNNYSYRFSFVKDMNYGVDYTIDTVNLTQDNSSLFFSCYYLQRNIALPFSVSNNYLGRLSWHTAYRLEALSNMYQSTRFPFFKVLLSRAMTDVLEIRNKHIDSWETKKYSVDGRSNLDLMVDEAMILYALLVGADSLSVDLGINDLISLLVSQYDTEYKEGHYFYVKNMPFQFDGCILPWNQQNIWGLCLLKSLEDKMNPFLKERVFQLAQSFKNDFVYTNDNRLLWHYWPLSFYSGWDVKDGISVNTPSYPPSVDNLYEDISHAGINALFVYRFYEMFPNEVFTLDDILKLKKTFDHFYSRYSRFISGDIVYQAGNNKNFPYYGWDAFANDKSKQDAIVPLPMILPDFDSQERCCYYSAQPVISDVCEISRDYFNKDFSKNYKLDFKLKIVNYFFN